MLIVHGEKRESKAELLAQARPFENISFCQVTDIYVILWLKLSHLFYSIFLQEEKHLVWKVENLLFSFKEYTC